MKFLKEYIKNHEIHQIQDLLFTNCFFVLTYCNINHQLKNIGTGFYHVTQSSCLKIFYLKW